MVNKQKILMLDTAMDGCGVAVFDAQRDQVFEIYNDESYGQAQRLVPMVQEVLGQADVSFDDLSDVIVCNGPGTFTGIRIGLATAGTFGLALEVPVHSITSLQALALCASLEEGGSDFLTLVETRRQDFYCQYFDEKGNPQSDSQSLMQDNIVFGDCLLIGNAVLRFDPNGDYTHSKISRIDVGLIARLFASDRACFSSDISPIYLRAPDVSQPKNKPRTLSDI
ncbi:MAG: tRNA (adenosine(37)-N6)-threonylcarbamoyltransferase complex dimerization subunit type 1 TsaB [Bdellovibrionales bacterium]